MSAPGDLDDLGRFRFPCCRSEVALAMAQGTWWSRSPDTASIGPRSGLRSSAFASVRGLMLAKAAWKIGTPEPATE